MISLRTTPLACLAAALLSTMPAGAQLVLSEVYYDAPGGDNRLEWVEIYNPGSGPVDLTGWSLGVAGSSYQGVIDLTGTLDPGRTYVIGGPLTNEDNGGPFLNLPIDLDPELPNSGAIADAVGLFNVPVAMISSSTVPVDAVLYGGSNSRGIIDETGTVGDVDVDDVGSGESIARTDLEGTWRGQAVLTPNRVVFDLPPPLILLSEVLYDAVGTDGGLEWVEIYNNGSVTIDLTGWSLGSAGPSYEGIANLFGTIAPGQTLVIGGPDSSASNGNPAFDIAVEFEDDLQNSGITADAVGLFSVTMDSITDQTVPVDAVIYGRSNNNDLIDETGGVGEVDVDDASQGESIVRVSVEGDWTVQETPTPGAPDFGGDGSLQTVVKTVDPVAQKVTLTVTSLIESPVAILFSETLAEGDWEDVGSSTVDEGETDIVVNFTVVGFPPVGFFRVVLE